jgi:hypothetical protein
MKNFKYIVALLYATGFADFVGAIEVVTDDISKCISICYNEGMSLSGLKSGGNTHGGMAALHL